MSREFQEVSAIIEHTTSLADSLLERVDSLTNRSLLNRLLAIVDRHFLLRNDDGCIEDQDFIARDFNFTSNLTALFTKHLTEDPTVELDSGHAVEIREKNPLATN